MRARASIWVALAAVLGSASAEGAAQPHAEPPPELIASVDLGGPRGLDGARAFVDAVVPGMGATISDQMVAAAVAKAAALPSLDGLDVRAPLRLLFVASADVPEIVLIARVADRHHLPALGQSAIKIRHGWVAIGHAPALAVIEKWALAILPSERPPSAPTLTFYAAHVVARYPGKIAELAAQVRGTLTKGPLAADQKQAALARVVIDGLAAAAADVDRVQLTLEADQARGGVDIALFARRGTRLAQFFSVQRPSDFALLAKLPSMTGEFVTGGHFEAGPYRQGWIDLLTQIFASGGNWPELARFVDVFARATTGDAVAVADPSPKGMSMVALYGLADRAVAETCVHALIDSLGGGRTLAVGGLKETMRAVPTLTHDGVTLRGYDHLVDWKSVPTDSQKILKKWSGQGPLRIELGVFDQFEVMASAPQPIAQALATRAIDAARGRAGRFTASPEITDLLAASRARQDSMVMLVNLNAISKMVGAGPKAPGTLAGTLGFSGGAAHFRLSLPASAIRGFLPRKAAPGQK